MGYRYQHNGVTWNGDRVRALRRRMGLTQRKFADAVGVSVSTISALENDRRVIAPVVVRCLCYLERLVDRAETAPIVK